MEVEKVQFSGFLEDSGPLLLEDSTDHLKIWIKRLDQVVASSMFLSGHIHAWEPCGIKLYIPCPVRKQSLKH